jgi:hypothetical protein
MVVGFLASSTLGRESLLSNMYRQFLADANSEVFVAFERETLVPKFPSGGQEIKLKNGSTVRLQLEEHRDYFTFSRSGSNFIISYSQNRAVTNESDLLKAEGLSGFDGDFYWSLSLDHPLKVSPRGPAQDGSMPAPKSSNRLTLVPEAEAMHKQGQFQSDAKLAAIRGLEAECLSVVQFGRTKQLQARPEVADSTLVLTDADGQIRRASLMGSQFNPAALKYIESESTKAEATLDYGADTLTITRSSSRDGKIYFQARYRICALRSPSEHHGQAFFSWQSYREGAGSVIATLMTNGATVALDVRDGQAFQPGRVLVQPLPVLKPPVPKYPIYLLFALTTVSACLLLWQLTRSKTTTT